MTLAIEKKGAAAAARRLVKGREPWWGVLFKPRVWLHGGALALDTGGCWVGALRMQLCMRGRWRPLCAPLLPAGWGSALGAAPPP